MGLLLIFKGNALYIPTYIKRITFRYQKFFFLVLSVQSLSFFNIIENIFECKKCRKFEKNVLVKKNRIIVP